MQIAPITVIVVQGGRSAIQPPRCPADVRKSLLTPIEELQRIRDRLSGLASWLPEPPEAMLEEEIPFDVSSELLTTVQHVLVSYMDPALERLRRLTTVTAEELGREWQAGRKKPTDPPPQG